MGTFQNSTKAKPKHKPKPFTADDENKNFPFGFDFLFIKKEIFVLGFALTSVLFWKSRDCVSKRLREIERAFEQDNAQLLLLYLTYLCMCNLTSFVQHLCCCFFCFHSSNFLFFFFCFLGEQKYCISPDYTYVLWRKKCKSVAKLREYRIQRFFIIFL